MRNLKINFTGFTLMDVTITTIIIGVVLGVAIPRFTVSGEKARSTEGVHIISDVWRSQQLFILENGAPTALLTDLDVDPVVPTNFAVPVLDTTNGQTGYIDRSNGDYRLYVSAAGNITCDDDPTGNIGICAQMGYVNYD